MLSDSRDNSNDFLSNIDPDENFLNTLFSEYGSNQKSEYFSIDRYNTFYSDFPASLSIINYNLRSFNANNDNFDVMLNSLVKFPEIITQCETWLNTESQNLSPYTNFKSYHTVRESPRLGGGVAVHVKNTFSSEKITSLSNCNESIESCVVKVGRGDSSFIFIVCIYRPPNGSITSFLPYLLEILNSDMLKNGKVIILGDLNINILTENTITNRFVYELQALNYLPLITQPTRFSPIPGIQPTLLDQIWMNFREQYSSGILFVDLSDHCPIFLHLPCMSPDTTNNVKRKIQFRCHNDVNIEKFLLQLSQIDWSEILVGNVHNMMQNFETTLDNLYKKNFPLMTKFLSEKRLSNPWITNDLFKCMKKRSSYFKSLKLGQITVQMYNAYRNHVTKAIRDSKKTYYSNIFDNSSNDPKKTWSTIKEILGHKGSSGVEKLVEDGSEICHAREIAQIFNCYFATVGSKLAEKIPVSNVSPVSFVSANQNSSFFLSPVSPNEISNIIQNLKKKSPPNLNKLPTFLLVLARDLICVPLSKIINESFISGLFPNSLKLANVVPIFKSGASHDKTNYRPISLLPVYSKIFERCIAKRLLNFLKSASIISPHQFGFQKHKSTSDALLDFVDYIYDSLNGRENTLNIFVDLKKAFDLVDHNILIKKLEKYGIRGLPLTWFRNYLSDRSQCVKIGNFKSEILPITLGVPQGSVIAPLAFILFINDLPNFSDVFKSILFADDTTFTVKDSNIDNLNLSTNTELSKFKQWTVSNKLLLNTDKTSVLLISNRPRSPHFSVRLEDHTLSLVSDHKFLGITIDDKLKFDTHIKLLCKKISKSIGIMFKLKEYVPQCVMLKIYYSLVYPYLIYGNLIWGGTFPTHLHPLFLLQKRAVRIVVNASYLAHTNDIFIDLKILKLPDIHKFLVLQYVFNNFNKFHVPNSNQHYSTRRQNELSPQFQRLSLTQHSLKFSGPKFWNKLPLNIRQCNRFNLFKKMVKSHLIDQYVTATV